MNAARAPISDHLHDIRGRIAEAARRSGRRPDDVVLVGAAKGVPLDLLREAVAAGLTDLGENRVQEAEAAITAVGRTRARWHMIGHVQRNKAGRAVELFDRIHSIDSIELAETLSRRAHSLGRTTRVLVQVNASHEPTKHGVAPEALDRLVAQVAALPALALDGLMSIGPVVDDPEQARPHFARTRTLRDQTARATGVDLPELSMGMSGDFEVAVEEGSTLVRVGTALFGPRPSAEAV